MRTVKILFASLVGLSASVLDGQAQQNRVDHNGDALPTGAVARLGTSRLRHKHASLHWTAFSPDSKILATCGLQEVRLWDLSTGRLIREIRDGDRPRSYHSIVFAPNGQWVAAEGGDAVCIWDVTTGQRLHELKMNAQVIAVTSDSARLIATFNDGSISIWDTKTGKRIAELRQGHTHRIFTAVTPNGFELSTMSEDNLICHWNLEEFKLERAIRVSRIPPSSGILFAPDGKTMAVSANAGPVEIWDTIAGKRLFWEHGEFCRGSHGLAFNAKGTILATQVFDQTSDPVETKIALWDAKNGAFLRCLRLPTRSVDSIRFSPDGRLLLTTASRDPVARFWDTTSGKEILSLQGHAEPVQALAFSRDGRSLFSGANDGTIWRWDVPSGKPVQQLQGHRWRVSALEVTPDGNTLVSSGADACIRVHDFEGKSLQSIQLEGAPEKQERPDRGIYAMSLTSDGKSAVAWSRNSVNGTYHVWDLMTGKEISRRRSSEDEYGWPRLSFDGRWVVEGVVEKEKVDDSVNAVGFNRKYPKPPVRVGASIQDIATGKEVLRILDREGLDGYPEFTPDGRKLVSISHKHELLKDGAGFATKVAIHVYDLANGKKLQTIACGSSDDSCIRLTKCAPNNRTLATSRFDGTIEFWDLDEGKKLTCQIEPGNEPTCLQFSRDSKLLATGHEDGTIMIWEAPSSTKGNP